MSANTVSLQTDLNVFPYYDDFDESKGYHRLLFNPSRAVQARELTQIQTVLQNQIDRFGEHMFKDGSLVNGGEFHVDPSCPYIKIQDLDTLSGAINMNNLPAGTTLTGQTNGVTAVVVEALTGSEGSANTKTLHIKYTKASSASKVFEIGEDITSSTGITFQLIDDPDSVGFGYRFEISEGILFAHDHFIRFPTQSVILSRYAQNPTAKVGFVVNETIVTAATDPTLNDPAQGSYNYGAPGADRLKLSAVLTVVADGETVPDNFNLLFETDEGTVVTKKDKPQYAVIREEFARRTFDESGNYTVSGLNCTIREHLNTGDNGGLYANTDGGNSSLLAVGVEPGKAYVSGYEYDLLVTRWLDVDKGIDTKVIQQQSIPTNYGNYVLVNEAVGYFDVNKLSVASLYDAPRDRITSLGGSTLSPSGNVIGTASIRAIELDSGNPGHPDAVYRVYLHDINMTTGPFTAARSIYFDNTSDADAGADLVLESGNAVVKEGSFQRSIFPLFTKATKTVRGEADALDNTFTYQRGFQVSIGTNGQFTVDTGTDNENFNGSGVLNPTERRDNFVFSFNNIADTANLTGTVSTTNGSNVISGSGTVFQTEFSIGEKIRIGSNTYIVSTISSNSAMTTTTPAVADVAGSNYIKRFLAGDIVDLGATAREVDVSTPRFATFDLAQTLSATANGTLIATVNRINGPEKKKLLRTDRYVIIDTATHSANTVGPWDLGISDIFRVSDIRTVVGSFTTGSEGSSAVSSFIVDNGQRDSVYDHGRLVLRPGATVANNAKILVKLSHFEHDTSQGFGYFCVDSYPVDDSNAGTANTINTEDIPIYVSATSGREYDLRDCIDMRPAKVNTANSAATVGVATTNPASATTYVDKAGIVYFPAPNQNFTTDITHYLPRKDIIILDSQGLYKVIRGNPDVLPITPAEPENSMMLATINVSPYPSLAPSYAIGLGRPDLAVKFRLNDNRRSTMRDINVMKRRIENLEYYTSLSLLERETADMKVLDENGLDRFKNGILIDSFTGHNVGDVFNADFNAAIDRKKQELRPRGKVKSIRIKENLAASNNIQMNHNVGRMVVASGNTFTVGESVYQGTIGSPTGGGTIVAKAGNVLTIETATGTWADGQLVKGASSGAQSNLVSHWRSANHPLAVLKYGHRRLVSQPLASLTRNAAGLFWNWKGVMTIDPPTDTWTDTNVQPDLRVNFDGNLDAWAALADAWGTDWNAWQTIWSGTTTTVDANTRNLTAFGGTPGSTTVTTTTESRTGTQLVVTPETQETSLGSRVLDTSVVPYMRSIPIRFSAIGMKPSSNLHVFFDGVKVNGYVTPTNSSFVATGAEGSQLTSDSGGNVYGIFRIPNTSTMRFTTGSKIIRIVDSPLNTASDTTTSAEVTFFASGLNQIVQNTIVSTQVAQVTTQAVTETRSITETIVRPPVQPPPVTWEPQPWGDSSDPIGQSWTIRLPNPVVAGCFVTKIDLFFRTKHASLPVTVEIREMSNGTPTTRRVPFSQVSMPAADILVSEDSSIPTTFCFDGPVFLKKDTEYFVCIKPAGSNPDVTLWAARLGDSDILTGQRIIQQPNDGVMFASANDSTWTAVQDEDLKYNLYCAVFDTNVTGTLIVQNSDTNFLTLTNVQDTFNKGQEPVVFSEDEAGANVTGTGYINYHDGELDMHVVMTSNTAIAANNWITGSWSNAQAQVASFGSQDMNLLNVESAFITFNFTNLYWEMKTKSTAGTLDTNWGSVNMNDNTNFLSAARRVESHVTEAGEKSLWLRGTMTTTSPYVSPVVDTTRFNAVLVENIINDDASGETAASGGTALARYICRPVTLADGQDAEDIKLLISVYRPPGTDIKAYIKILNGEDSDILADKNWLEMERPFELDRIYSDRESLNDFKEFTYNIPDASKTGTNGAVQYVNSKGITFTGFKYYAIKIVMLGTNSSQVPRLKDFRAIALQM